ncbi:hypothetical protein ONZ51_g8540 [Trametes cubensis]|uniref:F-box domain-containing protein n=1 Tax=Trametes cubensis TaxID=1111947 RepID=A0AAD7X841_9APHY|nr:hypothetical protein ONZ51_g8540 [Trametes cubensis]
MSLLDLPDELLVFIASALDFEDILRLQQVCTRLRGVVKSDSALQYALELRVAGMMDNPASRLVPGERLRILRAKEEAWRLLDLSDRRSIALNHNPSGIYDLTGGTLLLGERRHSENLTGTDAVHTINLHSAFSHAEEQDTRALWSNIDLGKQVIDVGLAIQEHDLIALVTYSYVHEAQMIASVDIHLLKHSTGQPHPAAAKPVLHFENIYYLPGHCSIMLEISGDTLCFLLNNYFPFVNADPVTLVVYNWKTGEPKVSQKRLYSDPTMFNSFVLLSPDTVVLPIIPTNALEVCQFADELTASHPPDSASPNTEASTSSRPQIPFLKTTCILQLPPLHPGALVLRMTCRCEPNPRGPLSSATHADRAVPFYSDPEKAIMILHLHIRLAIGITRVYTMIVHRSSLLRITQDALKHRQNEAVVNPATEEPEPEPSDEYRSVDQHSDAEDTDEGFPHVPGAFFHPFYNPHRHARRSARLDDASRSEDDDTDSEAYPITIPWETWGPAVTRWFADELAGTRWITTTCGQRFVRVRSDGRLRVYDFNQLSLRRYLHTRSMNGEPFGAHPGESILERGELDADEGDEDEDGEDEDGGVDNPEEDGEGDEEGSDVLQIQQERRIRVVLGTTMVADLSAWEMPPQSSLPYIETSFASPDEYESVLLDEDIIVGLKMDGNGRHIQEVVLHRIGGPMT